jgi:hypothetical protein
VTHTIVTVIARLMFLRQTGLRHPVMEPLTVNHPSHLASTF